MTERAVRSCMRLFSLRSDRGRSSRNRRPGRNGWFFFLPFQWLGIYGSPFVLVFNDLSWEVSMAQRRPSSPWISFFLNHVTIDMT